jgi:predicted N-acetyltransferase YhbS
MTGDERGHDVAFDASDVERLTRRLLRTHFRHYAACDGVHVNVRLEMVQIRYACRSLGNSLFGTHLDLAVHPYAGALWIADVQVAPRLRRRGTGKELVRVSDRIARALGLERILVMPLLGTASFWRGLGFVPEGKTARVLTRRPDS